MDVLGCCRRRFLQRKFDEAGPAAVSLVLPEVLANLVELMMDPFGNYLVQKMLDRCNEEQRLEVRRITWALRIFLGAIIEYTSNAVRVYGKDRSMVGIEAQVSKTLPIPCQVA